MSKWVSVHSYGYTAVKVKKDYYGIAEGYADCFETINESPCDHLWNQLQFGVLPVLWLQIQYNAYVVMYLRILINVTSTWHSHKITQEH